MCLCVSVCVYAFSSVAMRTYCSRRAKVCVQMLRTIIIHHHQHRVRQKRCVTFDVRAAVVPRRRKITRVHTSTLALSSLTRFSHVRDAHNVMLRANITLGVRKLCVVCCELYAPVFGPNGHCDHNNKSTFDNTSWSESNRNRLFVELIDFFLVECLLSHVGWTLGIQ